MLSLWGLVPGPGGVSGPSRAWASVRVWQGQTFRPVCAQGGVTGWCRQEPPRSAVSPLVDSGPEGWSLSLWCRQKPACRPDVGRRPYLKTCHKRETLLLSKEHSYQTVPETSFSSATPPQVPTPAGGTRRASCARLHMTSISCPDVAGGRPWSLSLRPAPGVWPICASLIQDVSYLGLLYSFLSKTIEI